MFSRGRPALGRLRASAASASAGQYARVRLHATNGARPPPNIRAAGTWITSKVAAGCLISGALLGYSLGQLQPGLIRSFTPASALDTPLGPGYGTPVDMQHALREIRDFLGEDGVDTDPETLLMHGFSEWSTVNSEALPAGVVYPTSTEDVSKIMKICQKYRIPVTPFSGGSSLEGHFSTPHGGISLDFAHMDRIIALNEKDMDIVVQPGLSWMDMNNSIESTGLFFPIDPGPSAKIGGMVGTNCSGTNAVRYGTMKDWVINMTVVMADGTVIKTRRRPRKSSAGYNLNGLFVGSEGTLGIVTEITLKLAIIPEHTSVAVVPFPTIREAVEVASEIMRDGIAVAALELMDDVQMRVVNRAGATGRDWVEAPTLFFKFAGTKDSVREDIKRIQAIAKRHNSGRFEFAYSKADQTVLWSARKQSLWSMLSMREDGQDVWSTDVAVPLSRLAELIEISKKEMDDLGMFASILGHVGDGNFHESIMWDKKKAGDRERIEKVVHNMVERALEMEGTCTGEHGVGLGKKEYLVHELGPETIQIMRTIKTALDPHWLLNPGKVFDRVPAEASTKK